MRFMVRRIQVLAVPARGEKMVRPNTAETGLFGEVFCVEALAWGAEGVACEVLGLQYQY